MAGLSVASSVYAQGAAQGAAAPAQPAAPDLLKFTTPVGGIIWYVKPEKTADFESVWATIKAKFSASDNPDYKTVGDSLKIYKLDASAGANPQGVMYLFIADPAAKTISYNPSPSLLFESKLFPDADARALLEKLSAAIGTNPISPLPLDRVP